LNFQLFSSQELAPNGLGYLSQRMRMRVMEHHDLYFQLILFPGAQWRAVARSGALMARHVARWWRAMRIDWHCTLH
jgi:hypothetical protein